MSSDVLLTELARIELVLAARRDFDAADKDLRKLRRRATSVQEFDGRIEVLVRLAAARAELELARGDVSGASIALERLLLVQGEAPYLQPASDELLAAEREALYDPRLIALRDRITRGVARPASWSDAELGQDGAEEIAGDPLLLRVHRALEEGDAAFLSTLGYGAVPALARLTELSVERIIADPERDPLVALVRLAELRAAEVALTNLERGGSFWRKRVLRAMADGNVLRNGGTWDNSAKSVVCREPQWLSIVERLCRDPELLRPCLPFLATIVLWQNASPPMLEALAAALRSPDPDLVQAAMQALEPLDADALEPVYAAVLDHPDAYVRLFGATQLAKLTRPEALLAAVDHSDPAVRGQALRWFAEQNQTPATDDLPLFERFTSDEASEIRLRALDVLARNWPTDRVPAAWLPRLAADPEAEIRALIAQRVRISEGESLEGVFLALARDAAPEVRQALDGRLGGNPAMPTNVLLAVLRQRWSDGRTDPSRAMPKESFHNAAGRLASTLDGVAEVVRWAIESEDAELLAILVESVAANDPLAAPILALEPELVATFMARVAALEPDPQLGQKSRNLMETLARVAASAAAPPVTAMETVLEGPDAPLSAKVRALEALVPLGEARLESDLLDVLRDPRWAQQPIDAEPLDRGLRDAVRDLARRISIEGRDALLVGPVRDRSTASAPTLELAGEFAVDGPYAGELAQAILERWFSAEGPPYTAVSQALWCASRYPERVAPETLIQAVRQPQYAINALTAMGKLRDPRYLPTLGECIEADWAIKSGRELRTRIQMQAVWALTQYLTDDAAEVLLSGIAKSIDDDVRQACFDAVDKISRYQEESAKLIARRLGGHRRDEAVARVAALLADPDPALRAQAARAAATLGAVELLPELIGLLESDDAALRAAVREALDRLNAPPREGG